ncbi:unnamed protein product [Cuscuta epithymum]|uniref:RNase H type-1 domain-containing protein n=1 Tax=Cuscuta epithymum TaxID=186058 RepID=A0AAV0ERS5_9ASTE|nr:unnamed protein product [Cuscuta epithymum]
MRPSRMGNVQVVQILRNQDGSLVAAAYFPIKATTVLQAEFVAAIEAVKWCKRINISDIQLESDSESLVNIKNKSLHIPHLDTWNKELGTLCELLQVKIRHVYREINMAAHTLAQEGMKNSSARYFFNTPYE